MVVNENMTTLENANPLVFQRSKERAILPEEEDDNIVDKIDGREVFGESEVRGEERVRLFSSDNPDAYKRTRYSFCTDF